MSVSYQRRLPGIAGWAEVVSDATLTSLKSVRWFGWRDQGLGRRGRGGDGLRGGRGPSGLGPGCPGAGGRAAGRAGAVKDSPASWAAVLARGDGRGGGAGAGRVAA